MLNVQRWWNERSYWDDVLQDRSFHIRYHVVGVAATPIHMYLMRKDLLLLYVNPVAPLNPPTLHGDVSGDSSMMAYCTDR